MNGILKALWEYLVLPKSPNKDKSRREFILNILLLGSIILSGVAFFINLISPLLYPSSKTSESPFFTGGILILLCFLLLMSRFRKSDTSAIFFVSLLFIVGVYVNYSFGADLAEALLLFALIIVMAGILISTKSALMITILSGCSILYFSYLEINHFYQPNKNWKIEPLRIADSMVYVITLGIIAIVSWLSNREIDRALKRAWRSEGALRRQRDKLETIVEKRTTQLKQAQADKLAQLYRFAQLGRSASGLFHDLVNPLNLVSLNVKSLGKEDLHDTKKLLERAMIGVHRLESFVEAARKQIQNQQVLKKFSLVEETNQVLQMLAHKVRQSHIRISLFYDDSLDSFGNPIKFNQLMSNLVSNAIDAYDRIRRKRKIVEIRLQKINGDIHLTVQDWGKGIPRKNINKIFEPLFTTKSFNKGTGIGLSICQDIVEKDFKGQIAVKSQVGAGTIFTVQFPVRKS